MPDLAASDVTVTVQDVRIVGRQRRTRCRVQFGDGAKTYPTGGVPLPAAGSFGMLRNLDFLLIFNTKAALLTWEHDNINGKLRGYWPTGGAGTAPVAASTDPAGTVPVGATAVTSTSAQPSLPETAGRAKEFVGATTTIPAQDLVVECVGW